MKKIVLAFIMTFAALSFGLAYNRIAKEEGIGAPPYGEPENSAPQNPYSWIGTWKRPEAPPTVGLQVGHWKSNEFPDELSKLRGNTGASGGGKMEWEVNFEIAKGVKTILESAGIKVDLLPATVPPMYWADVFLAVHADGSTDNSKRGYKFAGPWRDFSKKSDKLVSLLERYYEDETGFEKDPNITRNMRGYYAFSWWRYKHSVHPMTTSAIAEVGFLTNEKDRNIIVDESYVSSRAIANAILEFLDSENIL